MCVKLTRPFNRGFCEEYKAMSCPFLSFKKKNEAIDRWSQLMLHPKFLESPQPLMAGDGGVKFFSPNEGVHIGISGT
jgi:hypothetical protein